MNYLSEPLELSLEKMYYHLNVIKEITVTDSFLTLNKNIRGCQEESFDDCMTWKYKKILKDECQCLPFQIRSNEQVSKKNYRIAVS